MPPPMPAEAYRSNLGGRIALVQSIVRTTERGSTARARAIEDAAGKVVLLGARGRKRHVSVRTLRGWIAAYEGKGAAGMLRKASHAARLPEAQLSPAWDAAM